MPTYTYVCDNCGNEVEAFQSMSDDPLKKCPACKKNKLRRTFHPVGIVLKGSGFHRNDYRSTSKKPSSSESSESKSSESKPTETKSSESTSSDKKSETKKSESKKTESKN